MKGFGSVDSYKQLYYMLENPQFSQRQMARDLGMYHGEKISSFVNWLEDLRFVKKTYQTKSGRPKYEITSRVELVTFYGRFRNMEKLKLETYVIGTNKEEMIQFLNNNGGILCMTTALELYGEEFFRDPEIHVYAEDREKLFNALSEQVEGRVKVSVYQFDLPDKIKEKKGIKVTSATRTIMDLFCSNMAYATEQFIRKVWV